MPARQLIAIIAVCTVVTLVLFFVSTLTERNSDYPIGSPERSDTVKPKPADVKPVPKVETPEPDPAPKDLGESIVARAKHTCETADAYTCKWMMIYAAQCKAFGHPQKSAETTCIELYRNLGEINDREDRRSAAHTSAKTGTDLDNVDPAIQAMCATVLSKPLSELTVEEEGWKGTCRRLAWK